MPHLSGCIRYLCRLTYKNLDSYSDDSAWINRLKARGKLEYIKFNRPLLLGQEPSTDMALAFVESAAEQLMGGNEHLKAMSRLFGSEDIWLAYRRSLVELISQYFYVAQIVERLRDHISGPVQIVPNRVETAWACWVGGQLVRALASI